MSDWQSEIPYIDVEKVSTEAYNDAFADVFADYDYGRTDNPHKKKNVGKYYEYCYDIYYKKAFDKTLEKSSKFVERYKDDI